MMLRSAVAGAVLASVTMWAQGTERPSGKVLHDAAGDIAAAPGKVDSTLSAKWTHKDVRAAMKKVAQWQLGHSQVQFTQDWTYAPLYSGFLATSKTLGDAKYHDATQTYFENVHWTLLTGRLGHADDEAIGQSYEVLYREKKDPLRIAALRAEMDQVMARPDDPKKILWWWCDALYMAPSAYAEMGKLTGERKYIEYMDRQWDLTTKLLYVPEDHLYFRDATFLTKTEANGSRLFWSRGNGWVLAGLARTLTVLGKNDPLYPKYVKLYREMAEKIASLQPEDGLWRMGLLDQKAYATGEVSGTGFFTYALAWGVNNGLLESKKYQPVIERGWAGMLKQVYEDGRLGLIQPIGAAPGDLEPGSNWVYGTGAFLLAGSEIDKLSK